VAGLIAAYLLGLAVTRDALRSESLAGEDSNSLVASSRWPCRPMATDCRPS